VERPMKTLNWLSALEHAGENWRPHFLPDGKTNRTVRIRTNETVDDDKPERKPQWPRPATTSRAEITAEMCQRAFNEARKQYPDALYEELSEIAAKQFHVSARRLRKLVPNPFR
jgi:hypothetical protein